MASNEERAKLIGLERGYHGWERNGRLVSTSFDTDANAVAELRAFVRARGKEAEFVIALHNIICTEAGVLVCDNWAFVDAPPAQQCAAFDIVFKPDLEKL